MTLTSSTRRKSARGYSAIGRTVPSISALFKNISISAGRLAGAGDEGGDRPLVSDVCTFDSDQAEPLSEFGGELLPGRPCPDRLRQRCGRRERSSA